MTKSNIPEQLSQAAKDSIGAGKKVWTNYLKVLSGYFHGLTRLQQEQLITKFSWILALGSVGWLWCLIYPLFHPLIRLFAFPLSLALAYWFGKNIMSRIMIDRFSKYLNND